MQTPQHRIRRPAAVAALLVASPAAGHAEPLDAAAIQALVEQAIAAQQTNLDHVWTMLAAALVLFMQLGFLLLEAGMVRSKNSISVAQKNLADFLVATCGFWLVGFGLMFGPSLGGWLGGAGFAFEATTDWDHTFFVFQLVFCGTAATIVSGAIAERTTFAVYLIISVIVSVLIYPVFGHWAWGNLLLDNAAWLAEKGFIDFAGSTVVHSIGAWVALAGLVVIGPRVGRFDANGRPLPITGHSAVLATAGAIVLWVGWIGFNGGSTTAGTPAFAHIVSNTMLAGAFGGIVSMIVGRHIDGLYRPERSINGVLGGLVAITAGCDAVGTYGAIAIGASAGLVVIVATRLLEAVLRLDDAVGAVPVHGFCGAWGTLLVAVFARPDALAAGDRIDQFLVQAEGVLTAFAWGFGCAYLALRALAAVVPLRVSMEQELLGLNAVEHGTTLGTGALQVALEKLAAGTMDLSQRLDDSTGDEAAEVANAFNRLMARLQAMIDNLGTSARRLARSAAALDGTARELDFRSVQALHRCVAATAASEEISASLAATSEQALEAGAAARQASAEASAVTDQVGSVVVEIERLSQAIAAIAEHVRRTEERSRDAVARSAGAGNAVADLERAAAEIETVLEAIREIATKTRMLALNATIEATRAGEAGKGFAVVAQEVRQLAAASAEAADRASRCIARVNVSARGAGAALREITEVLQNIDGAVSGIKSAIEAQTSATATFETVLGNADRAVRGIDSRIGGMSEIADRMSNRARAAKTEAESVAAMMREVRAEVDANRAGAEQVRRNAADVAETAADLEGMIAQIQTRPRTDPTDSETAAQPPVPLAGEPAPSHA